MKPTIRKALTSAALWALATLGTGIATDGTVSLGEILTLIIGTPAAGWIVWRVPYYPRPRPTPPPA